MTIQERMKEIDKLLEDRWSRYQAMKFLRNLAEAMRRVAIEYQKRLSKFDSTRDAEEAAEAELRKIEGEWKK